MGQPLNPGDGPHRERGLELSRLSAKHVGGRIRELREAKGWNTNELAAQLGIRWNSVKNLENGKSLPSLATLIGLVEVFELRSMEEVLGDGRLGTTVILELEARARLDRDDGLPPKAV